MKRWLAVLVFAATAAVAAEPDAALLARIAKFREAARQSGPELWPGWNPAATPVALWTKDSVVLAGHPSPPASFRKLATSGEPAFYSESGEGVVRANTAAIFAGTMTSFISAQEFMAKPEAEAIALGLHELFHAHFQRIAPGKQANILVLLWGDYPELIARNRAMLGAEARALAAAAAAGSEEEARKNAAAFLALRTERRKKLGAPLHRYESGEESNEGLARYIEWKYLQKHAAAAADARLKALQNVFGTAGAREPFYAIGMAEAAVLDRLRPGWKQQFESGPLLLDELLAAAVPDKAGDVAGILTAVDFAALLAEQDRVVTERLDEGSRRLLSLMSGAVERVVVEIAAVKSQLSLRGFNPNTTMALTPDQIAHTFLLLDLGTAGTKMKFEFRVAPILYDRAQDVLWFTMPAETLKQAVDSFMEAVTPRPLVLRGTNFTAEFTGIELDRRPKEVRIRPSRDLKRAPELKPPEFVRP